MKRNFLFMSIYLVVFSVTTATAQQAQIEKYFSEIWQQVGTKDSAFYISRFVKDGEVYKVSSYLAKSNVLHKTSVYKSPDFGSPAEGNSIEYFETGAVKDSTYINASGSIQSSYSYHPNGKLRATYILDPVTKQQKARGFDENGKEIKDFIFMREASYPGGNEAWAKLMSKASRSYDVNAPAGEYRVVIQFIVDKNGQVTDLRAKTNNGFGLEEGAMSVIAKSKTWTPAIYLNTLVNAYRLQPFTFIIPEGKKKKGK